MRRSQWMARRTALKSVLSTETPWKRPIWVSLKGVTPLRWAGITEVEEAGVGE
jgi:hypothetical protein